MSHNSSVKTIKVAQREKQILRELSQLFLQLSFDHPELRNVILSRVKLSADKSVCFVYFYTALGIDYFHEKILDLLKVYKPSIRKNLSANLRGRYTPELQFQFDEHFEKQQHLQELLDQVSSDPE